MMETQTKGAVSKSDDGGWAEYVWYAVILYGIAGFFFYLSHKEEAPTALAWTLFALSPALLIAGGMLSVFLMGAGLVGMAAIFQSKWWARYEGALNNAQQKSELARKQGRKLADWGWRLVWFVIALPIIFVLLSWAMRAE
jgi:hypothetical protein